MKIIKRILLGILALVALVLVLALFAPKKFDADADMVINRPAQEVFDYIKYLKNQENYAVWYKMDPKATRNYSGTDGAVGATVEWDGEKTGQGKQVVTRIVEGKQIESDLFFMGSDEPAKALFTVEEEGPSRTELNWGIVGETPYPFNLMNWFVDMDKDFEEGLRNLKNILEARPAVGSKAYLLDYFRQTTERLKSSLAGLSTAQLQFKPSEDRWSISQCLEHIVASEKMLFDRAKAELEKPSQPERKSDVTTTDAQLIAGLTDRSQKYKAPEALQPKGAYSHVDVALKDLEATRASVLAFIQQADLENLRSHISESPGGLSDGYQNLLFIAAHCARHTLQIDEVKAAPGFPKS